MAGETSGGAGGPVLPVPQTAQAVKAAPTPPKAGGGKDGGGTLTAPKMPGAVDGKPPPQRPETEAKGEGGEQVPPPVEFKPIKRKVKVNGAEREIEIKSEADLDEYLGKSLASEEKFQKAAEWRKEAAKMREEAAELKRQTEEWKRRVREAPEEALAEYEVDLETLGAKKVMEEYRRSQLTEEQRKMEDLEREVQKYKAQEERYKQEQAQQQQRALQQRFEREFQSVASETMRRLEVGEREAPATAKMVLDVMDDFVKSGVPIDVERVHAEVQDRIDALSVRPVRGLSVEQVLKLLTPEQLAAIRQQQVEATAPPAPRVTPPAGEDERRSAPADVRTRTLLDRWATARSRG